MGAARVSSRADAVRTMAVDKAVALIMDCLTVASICFHSETIASTTAGTLIGVVVGSIVTVLVARRYYRRATRDLDAAVAKLHGDADGLHRSLNVLGLVAEKKDGVSIVRDEQHRLRAVQGWRNTAARFNLGPPEPSDNPAPSGQVATSGDASRTRE